MHTGLLVSFIDSNKWPAAWQAVRHTCDRGLLSNSNNFWFTVTICGYSRSLSIVLHNSVISANPLKAIFLEILHFILLNFLYNYVLAYQSVFRIRFKTEQSIFSVDELEFVSKF